MMDAEQDAIVSALLELADRTINELQGERDSLRAENTELRATLNPQRRHQPLDRDHVDDCAREAYAAYVGMDPLDEERQPDWGRTGYGVEAAVWQAVALAVIARHEAGVPDNQVDQSPCKEG